MAVTDIGVGRSEVGGDWALVSPVPSSNMKKAHWLLVVAMLLVLVLVLWPLPYLSVTDSCDQLVLQPFLGLRGHFTLVYRHSVQKTLCWEDFVLGKNKELVLCRTRYESLGVGLPFMIGEGQFTNRGGQFYLTGQNRHFPELALRAMPVAEQALIVRGRTYRFNDFFAPGSVIKLRAISLSPFQALRYKLSEGE
ncbi:MAG: DUF1850 domain-containing protein [Firmicutes bacterium]|nr:DUF1850 domain-containing protein [Bacillota bacterium]